MAPNTFSPKPQEKKHTGKIVKVLEGIASFFFIGSIILLPIFIIPSANASIAHSKIFLISTCLMLALLFFSLAVLRLGKYKFEFTTPVAAVWGIVIASVISALLVGNINSSFIGYNFSVFSVAFMIIFALVVTCTHLFLNKKISVMYLYLLLFASGVLLAIFHLSRIIFGSDFLSFGIATSNTFSLLGSWNDLGIFYGLLLILSLFTLEKLPLPNIGKYVFASVSVISLVILIIVQFTPIWYIIGISSLVILMYSLMRHRLETDYRESSLFSVSIASITAIFALIFIIGGNQINSNISNRTNINYLEVRPSATATLDIGKEVFKDNILLGIGPNRFNHAWSKHKDQSINETAFWNTEFTSGNSYIGTFVINTGLLGVISLIIFLFFYIKRQYQCLVSPKENDAFWYYIASSATIASVYLWFILFIYVPGASIIILTAVFTGIALTSSLNLRQIEGFNFDTIQNKKNTILLIFVVLIVIISATTIIYSLQNHHTQHLTFNRAILASANGNIEESTRLLLQATDNSKSDLYPRAIAENSLRNINFLLTRPDPTETEINTFAEDLQLGVEAAREAIRRDNRNPANWAVLAALYATYINPNTPEITNMAKEALYRAIELDPSNPELMLVKSQIYLRENNTEEARAHLQSALRLKSNYVTALNLLAELDISEGNIQQARQNVINILRLQPNNPGRHYQLGVLYLADNMTNEATRSLQEAIRLDNNFSNAHYLLALQYIENNQINLAIEHLETVVKFNQDNIEVVNLLEQIKSGGEFNVPEQPSLHDGTRPQSDGILEGSDVIETDLLRPLNPTTHEEERPNVETIIESGLDESNSDASEETDVQETDDDENLNDGDEDTNELDNNL